MLTASEVAEHFIIRSRKQGQSFSNSKLQSLLYYAQAWHLALFDRRLFADQIEAWESGPVMPLVFEDFERLSSHSDEDELVVLDDLARSHLDCMVEKYFGLSEDRLQSLIQSEAPWLAARATPIIERHERTFDNRFVIALNDMKLFYRYPMDDIFVRVVYTLCRLFTRHGIYQAGLSLSLWIKKVWTKLSIFWSFFSTAQ